MDSVSGVEEEECHHELAESCCYGVHPCVCFWNVGHVCADVCVEHDEDEESVDTCCVLVGEVRVHVRDPVYADLVHGYRD